MLKSFYARIPIAPLRRPGEVHRAGTPLSWVRHVSYWISPFDDPKNKYTEVEKSYKEWPFVERILPKATIPQPPSDPNKEYPSGWRPPNLDLLKDPNLDYFVARTNCSMHPVYVVIDNNLYRRRTIIKRIEGNIWQFDKDIANFLQDKHKNSIIRTYVNEPKQFVWIYGDYVEDVKQWLAEKGF